MYHNNKQLLFNKLNYIKMRRAAKNFIQTFKNVKITKMRRYTIEIVATDFAAEWIKRELKKEMPKSKFTDVSDYVNKSTYRIQLDPNDENRKAFEAKYTI